MGRRKTPTEVTARAGEDVVETLGRRGPSTRGMANQVACHMADLIDPWVRTAVGELYDLVFAGSRSRCFITFYLSSRSVGRRCHV